VRDADRYDAMFNYESHVLAANQALVKAGREPLHLVYPLEGLGIADFPLSFVSRDNADKEPVFLALQQFLLSAESQHAIAANGRRVGPLCDTLDATIARPEWGVDPSRTLNALKLPVAPVIWQALTLYQTAFRKPSFTVYCLDFSGSMAGTGEAQLKRAMRMLLDQREAATYLLQAGPGDVTVVITFDDTTPPPDLIARDWTVRGDAVEAFSRVLGRIESTRIGRGTNIYRPVAQALQLMKRHGTDGRSPAIIVMTDGQSNAGSLDDVKRAMADTGLSTVPAYGITFGDANRTQLDTLAELTGGRVFDGTKDLLTAFRNAKGNH
jgi:Ca-activated chloride channel family protein